MYCHKVEYFAADRLNSEFFFARFIVSRILAFTNYKMRWLGITKWDGWCKYISQYNSLDINSVTCCDSQLFIAMLYNYVVLCCENMHFEVNNLIHHCLYFQCQCIFISVELVIAQTNNVSSDASLPWRPSSALQRSKHQGSQSIKSYSPLTIRYDIISSFSCLYVKALSNRSFKNIPVCVVLFSVISEERVMLIASKTRTGLGNASIIRN